MGRAGVVGDEIGSSLIASRLVRDIMRLGFFMEREYPPYAKWFGTAFARLTCASSLSPFLVGAMQARCWRDREAAVVSALEELARTHNGLQITSPLPTDASPFHGRPYRVIRGSRFAEALVAEIQDPDVKGIAGRRLVGNVDLLSDNTDLVEDQAAIKILQSLYQ